MDTQQFTERLRTRPGVALVLSALAIIQIILYLPALKYDFVWDDRQLIVENRLLHHSSPWEIFSRPYWAGAWTAEEGPIAGYYRPITTLSFYLDYKIAGANPAYFHLINIVLTTLATVFVTLIIWELLHSGVWAGIAGLLFATHPAHVESVCFISGRTDLLMAVFITFAGFVLLRSFRKKEWRWWLLLPPLYALALLSKETALLFPLLVAATPFLIQTKPLKGFYLAVLLLFFVAIGYLYLRRTIFNQILPVPTSFHAVILTNIANSLGYYIRLFCWPFEHRAKIPLDPTFFQPLPYIIWTIVFLFSIPLAALRPRFRISLFGYLWAILFLLPVINIIPIGPQAAEKLLYLPSAGLVATFITLLSRLLVSLHRTRQVIGAALLLVTGIFGFDTLKRMPVWQNEITLFSTMIKEAPNAPSAYVNLAGALRSSAPDSAIKLYNRAIILDQGFVSAHINIAILYGQKADFRRMLHHLRLAEELQPNSVRVQNNLGYAFLMTGQPDSAFVRFNQALEIDSLLAPALLGNSLALAIMGRTPEANLSLSRLITIYPDWRDSSRLTIHQLADIDLSNSTVPRNLSLSRAIYINRLGSLFIALDDTASAEKFYLTALKNDPNCVPALYNLAVIAINRNDRKTALNLINRAIRLRPDLNELKTLRRTLR